MVLTGTVIYKTTLLSIWGIYWGDMWEYNKRKSEGAKWFELVYDTNRSTKNKSQQTKQLKSYLKFLHVGYKVLTRNFNSFDCFGGVVGDMDVDTDRFTVVVELRKKIKSYFTWLLFTLFKTIICLHWTLLLLDLMQLVLFSMALINWIFLWTHFYKILTGKKVIFFNKN